MNLARHLSIVWKFRSVALAGLLLGVLLAFLAAYDVSKLPNLERRGTEVWSAESKILVTQVGFPEGRVTLPDQAPRDGIPANPAADRGKLKFATPERLSSLALLYSVLANGDEVRGRLPGPPAPNQIRSEALDATGNRTQFLPVISLATDADTSAGAATLNTQAFAALKQLLESQQQRNKISATESIRLELLNKPAVGRISGPSLTPSILALLLCCLGVLALVHVLEALSLRQTNAGRNAGRAIVPLTADLGSVIRESSRSDMDPGHTRDDEPVHRVLWGTQRQAE